MVLEASKLMSKGDKIMVKKLLIVKGEFCFTMC
jgi:hypothetical protein